MNRFGAFGIHLAISLLIFAILGYLILYHWYPDFFFASDGGWQGIRIVAFVDLVLGPTLTLVVFNRSKPRKELQRDLTIIGVFQFSCLLAGTYVVYSERPIAMVYADGSFMSVTNDDYVEDGRKVPDFKDIPGPAPHWVSVELPSNFEEQSAIRGENLRSGHSLKTAWQYYVPFDVSQIDTSRAGISELEKERIGSDVFQNFIAEHGGQMEDYVFLPFGTRYIPALMALRKSDGELIYIGLEDFLDRAKDGNDEIDVNQPESSGTAIR